MNETFQKIKTISLVEAIGRELDFQKMPVEAGDGSDPIDRNTWKYIHPKDYYNHKLPYFTEKVSNYLLENHLDSLEHIFKNKVVVDLGSSYTPYAYLTALKSGASTYISVDCCKQAGLLPLNITSLLKKNNIVNEQILLVPLQIEMLSFLDASIRANQRYSFICSSYGDYPKDTSLFSVKFFDILRELLPKTTDRDGGILTISTDLQMPEFSVLKEDNCYSIKFLKLK